MKSKLFYIVLCWIAVATACKSGGETPAPGAIAAEVQTPVTVTQISTEPLADYVELTAVSSFLQSSYIKATANGFVKSVGLKPGEFIAAGKQAFLLQTKESKAIGNTINELDPGFKFSGLIKINVQESGYVTTVDHQPGDYVQDGEQLATISNSKSFGFLLNLPFELRAALDAQKNIQVELPDKTILLGQVAYVLPSVDPASQTQSVLIKVKDQAKIPANLVAKVKLLKSSVQNKVSLPKEAVLANESQTSFWVMKMIDSTTATRVDVKKGLEAGGRIEIIDPVLTPTDRIVLTGNYGLPDTAHVKVMKPE